MPFLTFLSLELRVALLALLPVIELRGAIPYGIALGLSSFEAGFFAYLGSSLPAFFILKYLESITTFLKQLPWTGKTIEKLHLNSLAKSAMVEKYGYLGLGLFVAIPLFGTGVWTGSLIAVLLKLKWKPALLSILLGNLCAGVVILVFSYGLFQIF